MTPDDRPSIDWAAARDRVAAAQRSIDTAFLADPKARSILLRERAQRLAVRHRSGAALAADDDIQVITFLLDAGRYAIDVRVVSAIGPWQPARPVPGTCRSLIGLFTARGEIWAMYDLASLLGTEHAAIPEGGYLLHLRGWPRRSALRVDRLQGIGRLSRRRLASVPAGVRQDGNFVSGISDDGLIVLDPSALRDHPDLVEGF